MPPSIPAAKPTASQLTSSAMERVTTTPTTPSSLPPTPPRKQSSIKPQSLLCTFGNKTNYGTTFPADGVCDYIFYDSMYKNNKNPLVANWDYDVYSILSKAQKTDKKKTQFGLGFAFEHRRRLVEDLVNSSLEVFWGHNVFHFGILDCPGHKTEQADMDEVFVALQTLDAAVQMVRASGNTSYIVLGAVSHTDDWNEYFKSKFGSVFTPDLFISVSHQFHGDPERINCSATPPTIVKKPQGLYDAHDLYDATRALGVHRFYSWRSAAVPLALDERSLVHVALGFPGDDLLGVRDTRSGTLLRQLHRSMQYAALLDQHCV
ncbi:hypothetical protein MRX96_053935 [Rhipicephalus microplus]